MSTFQDRIKELSRDFPRGWQAKLAKHCKITPTSVSDWLSGKTKDIDGKNLLNAAAFFGVDAKWLSTGEGPKWPRDGSNNGAAALSGYTPLLPSKFRPVWVVGRGAGGLMPERIWTDGGYPVGVTEEYAEVNSEDPHAFLIEVIGTSMVNRYNPGEFALVEPGTEPDLEDDVLVRLVNGETLLKQLKSRRGGLRLGSYNNNEVLFYKPEEVTWIYYVAHPVPRRKIKSRM